jgi:hypothetical protein
MRNAERLFSFTWRSYAIDPKVDYSHEQPTLVEFKLSPIPGGTLLVLTASGFDRIPSGRRARRESLDEFKPKPIDGIKTYLDHVSRQWDEALGRLKALVER